jgi:hypothetical protein
VRPGPLRGPVVDLALSAVGQLDADRNGDGVAVVVDVQAVGVAGPPSGGCSQGADPHLRIEQMFA